MDAVCTVDYADQGSPGPCLNESHLACPSSVWQMNSLVDYLRCADWLVSQGWTTPELLVGHGSSAGALLVAGAANLRPDLFKAMILKVTFLQSK